VFLYDGKKGERRLQGTEAMAYVEGYPGSKIKGLALRRRVFPVLVFAAVLGLVFYFSEGRQMDIRTAAAVVAVLALFLAGGFIKANPMVWKAMFNRSEFERLLRLDRMVADELAKLDDDHFVVHDFRFELFHVENLVITPRGIFVVHKIPRGEPLTVRNGMLYAGDLCLEKNTSNLWRICHLIHIVFRKGYKEDCMPEPILVLPEAVPVGLHEFEGISIVGLAGLRERITRGPREALGPDRVRSFAVFIKSKYA
jgi:hypothetical protein